MSQQSTRVILVRHGRSTFNAQGRYQGSSDAAVLTERGHWTAQQVGKALGSTPIDAVYTSPLRRVTQTTDAILGAMSVKPGGPVTIVPTLRELDLANWEGLAYETVRQRFSEAYQLWQQRPHEFVLAQTTPVDTAATATASVYPVKDLYQRAQAFWDSVLPQHMGQTLLLVSHGGTNHALISTALGLKPAHHHSLQQSNCGVSVLEFGEQQVRLLQLNQTMALGETLPKLKAGKQGLRLLLVSVEGVVGDSCQQLSKRLASMPIDFCLATGQGQLEARLLLQHCPQVLQLATENENFLQDWQRVLARPLRSQSRLITGVAIAPARSIQTLLIQTLGGQPQDASRIDIRPGQMSILHYPSAHRPVVQAINF
ncbi:MAG: histidine phosphatase family protein [Cyanobacteria bacterium P01_D01_bin.14]